MKVITPSELKVLERLIKSVGSGVQEIEVVKLNETEHITQLLAFIRTAEAPHYHAEHDLTFILLKGKGELYLEGESFEMHEGDIAFIPKGAVHFYTNTSDLSVLLANFCPNYDGKDSVKVEL